MTEERKAGIFMNFLMSATMILFMCSVNKFQINGFNIESAVQILIHYPLEIAGVMVVSEFAAKPVVSRLLKKFCSKEETKNAGILFQALFLTTIMSMIMTVCGPLIGRIGDDFVSSFGGYDNFGIWCFATWFDRWRVNFTMALFWNLLCAGPFSRWMMHQYKNRKKHSQTDCNMIK